MLDFQRFERNDASLFITDLPTYLENWNEKLKTLSIKQRKVKLTAAETVAIGLLNENFAGWFRPSSVEINLTHHKSEIRKKIAATLEYFPTGAFLRLGSRSGKDSHYAQVHGLKITDAESALNMLTRNSKRITEDLRRALANNYLPSLFLREWKNIAPWAEFRCFVKERKLIGISQYNWRESRIFAEIKENALQLENELRRFAEKVIAAADLDDFAFDVFIETDESAMISEENIKLLEINPFDRRTDFCLFGKDKGSEAFDGSFRYNR